MKAYTGTDVHPRAASSRAHVMISAKNPLADREAPLSHVADFDGVVFWYVYERIDSLVCENN